MTRCTLALILAVMACRPASVSRCGEEDGPPNPFGPRVAHRSDAVSGLLTRSNGDAYAGRIHLTRDKRLELYCDAEKEWYKLKLKNLRSLEWVVEFERQEKEWRWKDSGSDVKVYTGRTKIDRRYKTVAITKDGKRIEGHIRGTVIYVRTSETRRKYFLYWNHPSEFGQKPADLDYVRRIDFDAKHYPVPEKWPPLTRRQLDAVNPVCDALESELAVLGRRHVELKDLGGARAKLESQKGVELTVRNARGSGVRFRCARIAKGRKFRDRPRATLGRLGLCVFYEVLEGKDGRPGRAAAAALGEALERARASLAKLDAGNDGDPEK